MWTTVLILAVSVIFEPVRLGLTVLMLNRSRPLLQLLAFMCGGLTMGIGTGLVTLFMLRATPWAGNFTVSDVQIVAGLSALLIAVVLVTNVSTRKLVRRVPAGAAVGGATGVALLEPAPPSALTRLSVRTRDLLRGDSLCVAAASGLIIALPAANYLGAMAAILASGAGPVDQTQALVVFNVVAFTPVEIPLISYLAAPQQTRAFMAGLQAWLRSRSRRDVAVLLAAGGCVMLALGLTTP